MKRTEFSEGQEKKIKSDSTKRDERGRRLPRITHVVSLRRGVRRPFAEIGNMVSVEATDNQATRKLRFDQGFLQVIRSARHQSIERAAHGHRWDKWRDYNSPLSDYNDFFIELLARKFTADVKAGRRVPSISESVISNYSITGLLEGKKGSVVLDLMAPSGTITDLFSQLPADLERHGVSLSLVDQRSGKEKRRDARLGITQLEGDLGTSSAWRALTTALRGKKADLIMERASGALVFSLPYHEQYFRYAANRLWRDYLSENDGVLLLQGPHWLDLGISQTAWEQALSEQGIENYLGNHTFGSIILLVKKPDSPKELPGV